MDIFDAIRRVYYFSVPIRVENNDINLYVISLANGKVVYRISGSELVILPK